MANRQSPIASPYGVAMREREMLLRYFFVLRRSDARIENRLATPRLLPIALDEFGSAENEGG
jgi:hypothetical protein